MAEIKRKQRTAEEEAIYQEKLAKAREQVRKMKENSNGKDPFKVPEATDFSAKLNQFSKVKHVIAVMSGKGGVGKSLITSLLAVNMRSKGYKVGILDADLTGPSIPTGFGLKGQLYGTEEGIEPAKSRTGIDIVSLNLMLEDAKEPVVWRGPVIAQVVKQFWSDVLWQDIDYLFVDMPPGTGDVPLTVFQSLPVDGVVIVTSPQDMVSMIVGKAIKMAKMMSKPVIGLVENMSYFQCPDCQSKHHLFGESKLDKLADEFGIETKVAQPLIAGYSDLVDQGNVETLDHTTLDPITAKILQL